MSYLPHGRQILRQTSLPAKRRIDLGCGAFRIVSPTCE
jgi:hypothetical protein